MTGFLLHPPLPSGPDQTEPSSTTVCKHSASSNVPWKSAILLDCSSGFILWTCLMYLELEGPDATCLPPHLTTVGTRRSLWLLWLERSLWELKAMPPAPRSLYGSSFQSAWCHHALRNLCCPCLLMLPASWPWSLCSDCPLKGGRRHSLWMAIAEHLQMGKRKAPSLPVRLHYRCQNSLAPEVL